VKRPIDRHQFLRGDFSGDRREIRPPWSVPETLFSDRCTRCDDCITACAQKIIRKGSGGFPTVDFKRGACTFCGECATRCKAQAIVAPEDFATPAWQLELRISETCLSLRGVVCRSCGEVCESAAIGFRLATGGRALALIDSQRCNGCGACLAVCPVRSITLTPQSARAA
jgi:ferredoxin-type protein NapF